MRIEVKGRNLPVTEELREHVTRRFQKIAKQVSDLAVLEIEVCKERTIYYWNGSGFGPVSRYTNALIKLVPTQWGAPTFEIDGIKMLPTSQV